MHVPENANQIAQAADRDQSPCLGRWADRRRQRKWSESALPLNGDGDDGVVVVCAFTVKPSAAAGLVLSPRSTPYVAIVYNSNLSRKAPLEKCGKQTSRGRTLPTGRFQLIRIAINSGIVDLCFDPGAPNMWTTERAKKCSFELLFAVVRRFASLVDNFPVGWVFKLNYKAVTNVCWETDCYDVTLCLEFILTMDSRWCSFAGSCTFWEIWIEWVSTYSKQTGISCIELFPTVFIKHEQDENISLE